MWRTMACEKYLSMCEEKPYPPIRGSKGSDRFSCVFESHMVIGNHVLALTSCKIHQ